MKLLFLFISLVSFSGVSNNQGHYIGERFGGGIVFYVSDDWKHGLIVATVDQSTNATWNNGQKKLTGTTEELMTKGSKNTEMIINVQANDAPKGNYAAKICADYVVTINGLVFDDWYLPSKQELQLLFSVQQKAGDFDDRYYWSSNEVDAEKAWLLAFYDGKWWEMNKDETNYVRAIRAF